jgi:hypothetical protein
VRPEGSVQKIPTSVQIRVRSVSVKDPSSIPVFRVDDAIESITIDDFDADDDDEFERSFFSVDLGVVAACAEMLRFAAAMVERTFGLSNSLSFNNEPPGVYCSPSILEDRLFSFDPGDSTNIKLGPEDGDVARPAADSAVLDP